MKIVFPLVNHVFDLENGLVNSLIIENPKCFFEIVSDIDAQIAGLNGKIVLSQNDQPVSISKFAELITSFVPFNINQKRLLSKISSHLESTALSAPFYNQTMETLGLLERYLDSLAFEYNGDILFPKISINSILRAASPELRDDYSSLAEKVLDYMELVNEFDSKKTFILVNARSYICDKEIEQMALSAIDHGYQLLLIDNVAKSKLKKENRVIIDGDLCEI